MTAPNGLTALAVHAGAGRVVRGRWPRDHEQEQALRRGLAEALRAGAETLRSGGSALDAVVEAVTLLEDEPRFNAGRGSVLNRDGLVEMDASVMEGTGRRAGAVACISRIAHPVALARQVMERTPHVMLVGASAEAFAREQGIPEVDPETLVMPERRTQLARALARGRVSLDHDEASRGTVGCVARDAAGRTAAATSTGGMTAKLPGRVGDSPVPGAGTWADDASCAVSGTGDGEGFLRSALAHEVDAAMRHGGMALDAACRHALGRVSSLGFSGGCIAVGRSGPPVAVFTTPGMLRGVLGEDGEPRLALYAGESPAPLR